MKKITSFCLIILLLMNSFAVGSMMALAQDETGAQTAPKDVSHANASDLTYKQYISPYLSVPRGSKTVEIAGGDFNRKSGDSIHALKQFEGKVDVLEWKDTKEEDFAEWSVTVPDIGLYALELHYYALDSKNNYIELGLKINGETPSRSAVNLPLNKTWKNESDTKSYDRSGNEIRPKQVLVSKWQSSFFQDTEGILNEPYVFYFKKGVNNIRLTGIRTDFVLEKIVLKNISQPEKYTISASDNKTAPTVENQVITLPGEEAAFKSSSSITPMYDRTDAMTAPSDPVLMRYNTIGSYNWQTPGQWIEWSFDVTQAGYYAIVMRVRQNYQRAFPSNRRIYIDGQVPFEELMEESFHFSSRWYMQALGHKKPYRFFLSEGKHTIRMEVVPGKSAEIASSLQESVLALNNLYRRIIMVTGTQPDMFRDYALDKEIPGLVQDLTELRNALKTQYNSIQKDNGMRDGDTANIDRLVVQLGSFIDDIDTIPKRLSNFSSNISSLSAWMLNLRNQPLEIDYIQIQPESMPVPKANAGFFSGISYGFQQFLGSFVMDYNSVGDSTKDAEALNVWVGLGRDQVQIIKEMVDDRFTTKTGIPVNIKLAKDSMIQATFAGRGPDIALYVAQDQPVNLAVRNAVVNLKDFEDFDEATTNFSPQSLVPYTYNGGVYGMPLTNSFNMMFYRTDILKELKIDPPKVWKDLYKIIPIVQQKNMNIGLPKVVIDATGAGSGTSAMFDTLLLQKGINYFGENQARTNFDSPEALEAFQEWTSFYTKYGLPLDFDFYNRFRTGEMPLGIANYTLYNQLKVGAPELNGLWEMVQLPGTAQENGQIDRSTGLVGTCSLIFNKCNKENGWEFIKWFSGTETQAQYGQTIEALLGASARYDTANLEALKLLPWTKSQINTLMLQWENVKGIFQVPASYYISRNLYNAFRNVTIYYSNPREILYKYNKEMNDEIQRKRVEFELEKEETANG